MPVKNIEEKTKKYEKKKNLSFVTPAHKIEIDDAFQLYANSAPHDDSVITLIRPPIIFSKSSYSTPLALPIGLTYVAVVLEKAKYKTKIIDCPGEDVDNIRLTPDGRFNLRGKDDDDSIAEIDPKTDIIGVTIMFSQEWPYVKSFVNKVREKFPHATIVIGGEHGTAMPEYSLRDCPAIDYVIIGEGELSFLELVHKIRKGETGADVRGVCFIKDDQYIQGGTTPRLANINNMPWPAWYLIDLEPYFKPNYTMGISTGRNIALVATRGCPYQCTFCSSPTMWTTRYTMRPVKDVIDEIEYYKKEYQITGVDFYDLTAIVKKDWIMELINEFRSRQWDIVWQLPSGTRSEALDEEVLQGLSDTGCKFIVYAPESGSERTLETIKKRVKLDRLIESVKSALAAELIVKINFIIGFPFENRSDIYQTLWLVWKLALLKADDCNISTFSPYPGSELFRELQEEGIIKEVDDNYFEELMTQFDLTVPFSVCRKVGGFELMIYRLIGMGLFYVLSYLRRPSRIIRLVKLFFSNSPFEPRSLFEQRMFDLKIRVQTIKKQKSAKQKAVA